MLGSDILKYAGPHVGSQYVLGARAVLSNPNHTGPWDCAEYASWCAYQAYKIVFGTYGQNPKTADPYSGKWYEDAEAAGTLVPVDQALATPGAFLVRKPKDFNTKIGHVAICIGDGRLYEARSSSTGVVISTDATQRNWTTGVHLPGVLYSVNGSIPAVPPNGILTVRNPFMRGDDVRIVQCALERKGFSPGVLDGIYGGDTANAATNFQIVNGLSVDGEVGPETAKALGIGWPIDLDLLDDICDGLVDVDDSSTEPEEDDLRGIPDEEAGGSPSATAQIEIEREGSRNFWANVDNKRFFVGTRVPYGAYIGLHQKIGDLSKLGGGVYNPTEAANLIGNWAHVLHPTILGESSGYFGRLNTYDRARFTFGCFQMAAHTARDNLILFFRRIIAMDESTRYFPDLLIKDGKLHRSVNGYVISLEREEQNPKTKEMELPDFMAYLNPTSSEVETEEALAAARLMLWTEESEAARLAQITMAKSTIQRKIRYAQSHGLDIYNLSVPLAIFAMDLRHQGRAKISQIKAALKKSNPYEALKWAGTSNKHVSRVNTVDAAISKLMDEYPSWTTEKLSAILPT